MTVNTEEADLLAGSHITGLCGSLICSRVTCTGGSRAIVAKPGLMSDSRPNISRPGFKPKWTGLSCSWSWLSGTPVRVILRFSRAIDNREAVVVSWDAKRYADRAVNAHTEDNEQSLKKEYPPVFEDPTLCRSIPTIIIDQNDFIIGWYLPRLFSFAQQVSVLSPDVVTAH